MILILQGSVWREGGIYITDAASIRNTYATYNAINIAQYLDCVAQMIYNVHWKQRHAKCGKERIMSHIEELGKYRRVTSPDKELLAELVIRAKGARRSMRQFASDCNVNPSTLSRIINKKTQGANSDELIAAIADHADPDSGVTFEMLMKAHGMVLISDDSGAVLRVHIETGCRIIKEELLKRGYSIKDGQEPWLKSFLGGCHIKMDIRTDALGEDNSVWLMDVWTLRPSEVNDIEKASDRLLQWLLMYVGMLNVDSRRVDRFSVVISNEALYRYAVNKLEQFTYRNDISVILVDVAEEKVVEEYLVKMDQRYTKKNVFFKVEGKAQEGDDGDVRSGLFERPEII